MSLVIIERHYITNRTGTEIIGGGWCFECPGCLQLHFLQTLTAAVNSTWELIVHGSFGEKVSLRKKGQIDLSQPCIFVLTDNHLRFDIRSKHHLKGASLPFHLHRS